MRLVGRILMNIGRPAAHGGPASCLTMLFILVSTSVELAHYFCYIIPMSHRFAETFHLFLQSYNHTLQTHFSLGNSLSYSIGASHFNDKSCSGIVNSEQDMSCVRRNFEIITVFCGNVCQEQDTSLLGESCQESGETKKGNNTRA